MKNNYKKESPLPTLVGLGGGSNSFSYSGGSSFSFNDDEYDNFVSSAKKHVLSLEDVHYLLNKEKTAANTANSTKKDMLNQMKNVRNIPTSLLHWHS